MPERPVVAQRVIPQELLGLRAAAVVHYDQLPAVAPERLLLERVEQPPQAQGPAVGCHDDADGRRRSHSGANLILRPCAS